MPFTPFHFGPGILIKSAMLKKFSLTTFIITQIFIDIETLRNILSGHERLHTFFHSYIGSTMAAAIVFGVLTIFSYFKEKLRLGARFVMPKRSVILVSALVGGWSHTALDSIMHSDLQPLWPFSEANSMLGLIPLSALHLFCVVAAVVGFILWIILKKLAKK